MCATLGEVLSPQRCERAPREGTPPPGPDAPELHRCALLSGRDLARVALQGLVECCPFGLGSRDEDAAVHLGLERSGPGLGLRATFKGARLQRVAGAPDARLPLIRTAFTDRGHSFVARFIPRANDPNLRLAGRQSLRSSCSRNAPRLEQIWSKKGLTGPRGQECRAQVLEFLAPRVGLEPTTCGLTVRRSTD